MKVFRIALMVWLTTALFTAGVTNADMRETFPNQYGSPTYARQACARTFGAALVFGPFGFIMSPFTTGFYQHGWTLDCGGRPRA